MVRLQTGHRWTQQRKGGVGGWEGGYGGPKLQKFQCQINLYFFSTITQSK